MPVCINYHINTWNDLSTGWEQIAAPWNIFTAAMWQHCLCALRDFFSHFKRKQNTFILYLWRMRNEIYHYFFSLSFRRQSQNVVPVSPLLLSVWRFKKCYWIVDNASFFLFTILSENSQKCMRRVNSHNLH